MRRAPARAKKGANTKEIPWHSFPLGDVFMRLGSKREGLSQTEAEKRLKHFGLNEVGSPKAKSSVKTFLRQFLNPLVLILIFAAGAAFYVRSFLDAGVILAVVVLNSAIGFFQEYKAEKSLDALRKLETPVAVARRDGVYRSISAASLTPGDIIFLKSGDKIPADARLAHSFNLKTDESVLTGESAEVLKSASVLPESAGIFERTNTVFAGTAVVDGSGAALVFGTGENSEIRRASRLTKNLPESLTLFERKINKLGRLIGFMVLVLSLAILVWGLFLGRDPREMFLTAVAIAVAAIPESLPVAVTVILVVGMRRVLKEKGLVRSLAAAENLGGASVILTDKTGTLTQGEMQVVKVLTPERRSGLLELNSTVEYTSNHLLALSHGLLSAEIIVENPEDKMSEWVVKARPVDKALFFAAVGAGLDFTKLNQKFKKLGEIVFNSERKFAVSFRENEEGEVWAIAVGAPDMLLSSVKKIQVLNRFENAIPFEILAVKEAVTALAQSGLRTIAVCSKKIDDKNFLRRHFSPADVKEIISGLNLVGILGLKDPVRPDAKDFLALARRAGLRTVMVTGDHTATARTVAKEVGLISKNRGPVEIMEGKDVAPLDVSELAHRVRNVDIFSRVTPEHKLKITQAWQKQGEVVAVVGDGVNDAPALKAADIGVALASGVDLAKETSDLVLLENSFSVLVKAIGEGRVILENIKKVVAYFLSTSLTEIILVGLALFFGWPLPVAALQILWVNLLSESWPALALALDPAEKDVMASPPIDARRPILDGTTRFLVVAVSCISAGVLFLMFVFFKTSFESVSYAQTTVFAALSISTLAFSFSVRSLRKPIWDIPWSENKYLLAAASTGAILLVLAIYWPPLVFLLKTEPVGAWEWLIILGVGLINLILIELAKWLFMRKHAKML